MARSLSPVKRLGLLSSFLNVSAVTPVAAAGSLVLVIALGASLTFIGSEGSAATVPVNVEASAETDPVPHDDDAADDPAIWVNPTDAAASTVIGTDKRGGIAVYDLGGRELQYLADGNLNNVDLRGGFSLGGESVTIATASNRTDNSIAIYRIDPASGLLSDAAARPVITGTEVYGSCMYRDADGRTFSFVTSEAGEVEQWELIDDGSGRVDAELARAFEVGSQVEGCVADDEFGQLYIGEEEVGIWAYAAAPDGGNERTQVAAVDDEGPLVGDVEGLTIAYGPNGAGFLLASSQGDSTFVVFERSSPHDVVLSFSISEGQESDGVSETDGIDVTTADLGPAFPSGVFVAQDGENEEDGDDQNQNYKLVPWDAIDDELTAISEAG